MIATNVDNTKGAAGNDRQAFIGQDFVAAGYALAKGLSTSFPADGPISIVSASIFQAPISPRSEQRG